jgi:hypothetical protein
MGTSNELWEIIYKNAKVLIRREKKRKIKIFEMSIKNGFSRKWMYNAMQKLKLHKNKTKLQTIENIAKCLNTTVIDLIEEK